MKPIIASSTLKIVAPGIFLAIATILLGQILGIVFGLNEEAIQDRLHASAVAVRETVYHNDDGAIEKVEAKAWIYMQRSHLHAGALGTTAVTLIILAVLMGIARWALLALSLALGAGGFGYSFFWMWAGFRAPGLGGTGAAKESLRWLAMPSSGAYVVATVGILVLISVNFLKAREEK